MPLQTRVLTLNAGEIGDSILYRLEQGWILRFRPGPSLFSKKVNLEVNIPKKSFGFNRYEYRTLEWENSVDCVASYVDVPIYIPGSFHYKFAVKGHPNENGSGYIIVDPELEYGANGELLPLDCIQCQTIISKNLGEFKNWNSILNVGRSAGYNFFHFTPVQELGGSNSAYSLSNQAKLNPNFKCSWPDLEKFIKKMEMDWKILSLSDIVLNHTANESKWIKEDPLTTYNICICPHLGPAYILDRSLFRFTEDIQKGKWIDWGLPEGIIEHDHHLNSIQKLLYEHYLPELKLHEFFQISINEFIAKFEEKKRKGGSFNKTGVFKLLKGKSCNRWGYTADLELALSNFSSSDELRESLIKLNCDAKDQLWIHLHAAVNNIIAGIRYQRIDPNGPKIRECSSKNPLITPYFTHDPCSKNLAEDEDTILDPERSKYLMAHNGWVMNYDPVKDLDFVHPDSNIMLRRELIAWGDSVKLRYGLKPEDSPFLWNFMTDYVENTARVFHGIRLDNCHSTPIHVAEYLLDKARAVRPNIYIIAELFTSSEGSDNTFVNRLGINSLIRENLSASSPKDLGRLVHRFGGGKPVGSFYQGHYVKMIPSTAHAIFFDQTHDNPSLLEKRTGEDLLPSSGLMAMGRCAIGSNRGVDEFVPHHISVVDENRVYGNNSNVGMVKAKAFLNSMHHYLGSNGYTELYVDQITPEVVSVTRTDQVSRESFVAVAYTCFDKNQTPYIVKPLEIEGNLKEVYFEGKIVQVSEGSYVKSRSFINGVDDYDVLWRHSFSPSDMKLAHYSKRENDSISVISFNENFVSGSLLIMKFELNSMQKEACMRLQNLIGNLEYDRELSMIIDVLTLKDMNYVLFRCDSEEMEDGNGGVYVLDGYGPLPYAGLQGFVTILDEIRPKNDTGNWLPDNLRKGNWALDYVSERLKRNPSTRDLGDWFSNNFEELKKTPRYLIPKYFDGLIKGCYSRLMNKIWSSMSRFVRDGSDFVKALALGGVIHGGVVKSATIPNSESGLSLAAGLPHFSTGYMRNWGRDTFISLRGALLLPGRLEEAKKLILGYGAVVRHGLIPNLLDGGLNSRYNCRDAVWFWLRSIRDIGDPSALLNEKVLRYYPRDDSDGINNRKEILLRDLVQECLQRHFEGIDFVERNSGKKIDEHMKEEGFRINVGVDKNTGFVFGGNLSNCGTWMDKMGSSCKAGIKGVPATPRDGSPVEIVGLCYSAVTWLQNLYSEGLYPYSGVNTGDLHWTWKEWADKIKNNFEKCFYVDKNDSNELVNKKCIYKDVYGSKQPWADFQLRPNFPLAMVIAPSLFDPYKAKIALEIVGEKLRGPLGLATLDPDDWKYKGDYDNSDDSEDPNVAQGINYHQGPEWVWPMGYYLRSVLYFWKLNGKKEEAEALVKSILASHYVHINESSWKGLPELTNSQGKYCQDSNPIQAWSMACLLEVLYDLKSY